MKIKFLIFLILLFSTNLIGQIVNVVDYGATPNNSTDDDRNAIVNAIAACRSISSPTLYFPKGTYNIISTNGSGTYFYINGINNLTIDGSDCTIEVMGLKYNRHIFEFVYCKNLTVNNIKIDYQQIPFSQGQLISKGTNYMDVKIMTGFNPQGKSINAYALYDNITGQQINDNEDFGTTSWTWLDQSNNIIRMNENTHNYAVGSFLLMRHAQYDGYSFIVGSGCKDVVMNNINVFLAPGYPFHANNGATNLTYRNCKIIKKDPSFWATSTVDGAHFTDIRGEILFDNCYFESMCDDAINLHGYFHSITQSIDSKTIRVQSPQSWYTANGYVVGDTVEILNSLTQQVIDYNVISNISNRSGNLMTIQFVKDLPAFINGISNYKMANISILGNLTVTNSTFKGNRARGILVSTADVLIENCTFERVVMAAILFEVSNSWNESRPAKNVIIRNNTFDDCGHFKTVTNYGVIHFEASITGTTKICDVFKNITIKDNTFKNIGIPAIYAKHVAQLNISNNTILSADPGRNLIRYGEGQNTVVDNNIGAILENMGSNCIVPSAISSNEINPIRVFPNPTDKILNFVVDRQYKNGVVSIMDVTGKVLISELLYGVKNTIDLSILTKGIYILFVEDGNEMISSQKLIKL